MATHHPRSEGEVLVGTQPWVEDGSVALEQATLPPGGRLSGLLYQFRGNPATIGGKMSYANGQGLGGAFFWELSGDTTNGELISAVRSGLG